MDMKEASAMTEASGLVNDPEGAELAVAARLNTEAKTAADLRGPRPSQDVALRLVDRLRETAMNAPLRSLLAAFLVGVLVARRR
ncbi:hypothetical protein [Bradyrhizobium sp. SBR1B]|uniref:hypothetical protein n=1 Tax=Bradyrhizobium sp. SBR1B TaxID=2663836 RepID=UPI0016068A18|nr:hypothetical protein [Bradyrhizobium sp. SBR1B]MBB4382948.1 hypothetical protein [Bradyrhizobium sp. SBR1B]